LNSNSIDLVIFDCDGVLIDSEVISARVIVDMLALEGVLIDVAYVYQHFLGQQFSCVGQTVLRNFSVRLPDYFESHYREQLLLAFETELRTTSGVKDVLSSLGARSCVATSSSRLRTQRALELVGLTDYFDEHVFTASEVEHGKPAPDLFLLASEKMEVEPERCLVIEDSLMGLSAGMAAGMKVWHYSGGHHLRSNNSDLPKQFSQIPVFNNWGNFYKMAPYLQKKELTFGDHNDR